MIVLIHGSTCGATYSFLRKNEPNGCFDGFAKLVSNGNAKLFWWAKCTDKLTFWQTLNPFKVAQTYQIDKKYVRTKEAQTKLDEFLKTTKPKIIIAHSVGCEYLLEYLANYQIYQQNPTQNHKESREKNLENIENFNYEQSLENLEKIYLLQSDGIASDFDFTNFTANFTINSSEKFDKKPDKKTQKVEIWNYFCPFDMALISSVLVNWRIPDGLFGSQNSVLQNRFAWLNNWSNPHATMPKSEKFAERL